MRVNTDRKTVDVEVRDVNYILSAYVRSYLFASRNEDPVEIIFPMYSEVPHPTKPGVMVPVKWIIPTDQIAAEIAEDGKDIPEVTPEEEVALDAKDDIAKEVKEQTEDTQTIKIHHVPKTSPPADRVPKMPASGDLGPGAHADNIGSRDVRLSRQIVGDLKVEAGVDEAAEIPAEIEKPKE